MAFKTTTKSLEQQTKCAVETSIVKNLMFNLENKVLNSQTLLHNILMEELEAFTKRNLIQKTNQCCPRCLKAYVLKRAKELNLDLELINLLEQTCNCETGHMGYYLDKGHLIKI